MSDTSRAFGHTFRYREADNQFWACLAEKEAQKFQYTIPALSGPSSCFNIQFGL